MRKVHPKDFKFKVALEAIKGELTIAQIVSKYQVAESLVHKWRKQLMAHGSELFGGRDKKKEPDPIEDVEKLHATIGRLKVENDFLGRALLKSKNESAER
jgi:transposase